MKGVIKKLICSYGIMLVFCAVQAQITTDQPFLKFNRLDESNGLSNNVINDILQDKTGFIWVATGDGLFRYDGNEFVTFKNEPTNVNSLPHNSVQALFENDDNEIWALTDYGIGIYDTDADQITRILPGEKPEQIPHKSITSITQNADGSTFIGTFGGGVVVADSGYFNHLVPQHSPEGILLEEQLVSQVFLDRDSVLWIGTWNEGLFQYNLEYNRIKKVNLGDHSTVRVFDIYSKDGEKIWVGTNAGLFQFNSPESVPLRISNETHDWLPDNEILSVFEDDKEILWIGTRNAGLISVQQRQVFDDGPLQIHRFEPSSYSTSVSHRTISKIYQDRTGNIWLGTHNSGINLFNPDGEAIRTFTYVPDVKSLSHQSVWGIAEADHNRIWIGTDGGGVNLLDPYTQEIENVSGNDLFSDKAILSALTTASGKIWLGTYAGGINVYDPKSGDVEIYQEDQGLYSNDIRCLREASDGKIWIATNGGGLHQYDPTSRLIKHISATENLDIRDIEIGSDGIIWLATFGDGLVRYQPSTGEIELFNWYSEENYTPVAFTVYFDGESLWIGTRQNGLMNFNPKSEKFTSYNQLSGLPSNTVRGIQPDDLGHIWVSTNVGISCFDPATSRFRNFDSSHGLKHGQLNDNSTLRLSNGDLVFGGIHGVNIFTPSDLLAYDLPPIVVFTSIRTYETSTAARQSVLDHSIIKGDTLSLNHSRNTITIDFNALYFPDSERWNYDYMLTGVDPSWIENEHTRSVTYRNLPPGTFEFKIRSTHLSGSLKGDISNIYVSILPPWWKTWPAYSAYVILLSGFFFAAFRMSSRRAASKQKMIYKQKISEQKNSDMEQKIRFFTNFSHELRTPLTLIQGPVNDLLKDEGSDENRRLLGLIKRNSSQLLRLVNRLLEFRKIETEKIRLNIGLHDLAILAQEEVESFSFQTRESGIAITLKSEDEMMCWCDIEKIQIILNNLLSNAVKYTSDRGQIELHLEYAETGLEIHVSDTGIGVAKGDEEAIFSPFFQAENSSGKGGTGIGLALTKTLVEMHYGSISVTSGETGSMFSVSLPNAREMYSDRGHIKIIDVTGPMGAEDNSEDESDMTKTEKPVVLIADDNIDIGEYVADMLGRKYTVLYAKDGREALDMILTEVPDLVVSDIMMPGMDGLELCRTVKNTAATNHIPVILLTAKSATEARTEGYQHGADSYITKPFSSEVLMARVENLLEQRRQLRDLIATGQWENQPATEYSAEIEFMKKVESTVLELVEEGSISVPTLSRELGFSRTSLYRKIKTLTGLSIDQFMRMVKMKRAAQLLSTEDVTVSEVAFSLGLTDLKHFRKCFKDQYGMMPSHYRKENYSRHVSQSAVKDALKLE